MNPIVVILLFFIIPVIALIILRAIADILPSWELPIPSFDFQTWEWRSTMTIDLGGPLKDAVDSIAATFGNLLSSILQTLATPFIWLRDTINLAVQNEALATVGAITATSLIIFAGIYLVWRYSPWTS